ncbi:MAG: tetratricopeptide repeat protein [Planctomycetota bacterium]
MNCTQCKEQLVAYVEGILDSQYEQQILLHLQQCSNCRAEAEAHKQLHESLQDRMAIKIKAFSQKPISTKVMNGIFRDLTNQSRRSLMHKRYTKIGLGLAAVAAIIIVVGLSVTIVNKSATPAWAIEQTINALQDVKTVYFSGIYQYDDTFKCWFIPKENETSPTNLRFESDSRVIVIQNNSTHHYFPRNNEVLNMDDSPFSRVEAWALVSQINLWVGDAFFQNLKEHADNWEVSYGKDEQTNRNCAFVTCYYKPSNMYFWFVFDMETKLVVRAKQWWTPDRNKKPFMTADQIIYNQDIPDEIFTFEPPKGAKSIDDNTFNERESLYHKADKLYSNDKYSEALELYKEIYSRFPEWQSDGDSSLKMIGLCYYQLGEHDKAVEFVERSIREHPHDKDIKYYQLGYLFQKTGQKDKALEAYRKCVEFCNETNNRLLNDARNCIKNLEAELKTQN